MPVTLYKSIRFFCLFLLLSLFSLRGYASHIYGVDLYYTWVSGNTYTIYMAVYGDCSGTTFYSLSSAAPVVDVYNGGTFSSSLSLSIQAPAAGVEVTPVCPAQAGNTTCTNISNPLPGIKKFLYKGNVTLPGTSSVWRFVFNSAMGGSTTAGRSGSITNIYIATGASSGPPIQLVDTLNNTAGPNSSAIYTSIPTPFFCINTPVNFNPGSVDPDGNSLSFSLVPGMDASTGSSISYNWPYSAAAPLGVTSGTFSFGATTGQLSFTPNIIQKALVVYNVREMTGSTLKGTSQREMTVVVLGSCSNNPPAGAISGATAGSAVSATQLNICNTVDSFSFRINPTDADGDTIDMSVSGLPAGAAFTITNNGTTAPLGIFRWVASSVAPGSYVFYVTLQDHGCPISSRQVLAFTVNVLPVPSQSVAVISAATCTRRAVLHITPAGAYSPWQVNVMAGSTALHIFTGVTSMVTDSVAPGTYTIRTYNPAFCYRDTTIVLAAPPLPSGYITVQPPLCNGDSTGRITIVGGNGAMPYQYALGSGSYFYSGVFTGLPAGTYPVHIMDANGCVKDTIATVPVAPPIRENLIIKRPLCSGFADGRVIIRGYNTTAPYTYAIGSGAYSASDTFSGLSSGTYIFHVKDANGCIDDTTLLLRDSLILRASFTIAPVLCYGGDATITVTGSGGTGAPYTYAYNSSAFGPYSVFTLSAAAYVFHVKDSLSCLFDTSVVISQPAQLSATYTVANVTCFATANGRVIVSAGGGTTPYQFALDGGGYGSSATITGIAAGTHTFTVKDANGCLFTDTFTITQPSAIIVDSVALTMPSCFAGGNGRISVFASGGVPSYTYAINSGSYGSGSTFTGLAAGSFALHVKDANGCIKDTTVTLAQPTPIIPSAAVTNSLCATLANGVVILAATGGTPSYTYALGSGSYSSASSFGSLAAGTYTFHIKDANGCIKDTALTIINATYIYCTFSVTPVLCFGDSTGIITVTGAGGTPAYTFALGSSSFSATDTFTHLPAGTYTIFARDSNGCKGDTAVQILQPVQLSINLIVSMPSCNGYADGAIIIHGAGGVPGYTYSFNGGSFLTATAYGGLSAGTDTIAVRDANGCIADTTITIAQPLPLLVGSLSGADVACYGGADGMVTVNGAGGTPLYLYAANSAAYQVSNVLTGLPAGTHTIHIKDNHGCLIDTSITLSQPPALVFTALNITMPTCEGFKDGAVTIAAGGGTAPYYYSPDNAIYYATGAFPAMQEGTYTFYINDAHHCTADTTVTLSGYPHIVFSLLRITPPSCAGNNDGSIAVTGGGGVPPFSYTVSNGQGQQPSPGLFTGLTSGTYTVSVTDSMQCVKDTVVTLINPDTFRVTTIVTPNNCVGNDNDGTAMAVATGGHPPYTYLWSNGSVDSMTTGRANGSYTVWVKDINNCNDSATAWIGYDDCCIPMVPTAFSPNGDGKNDVFRLKYKGDIRIIEFSVFNRYGERVFVTEYSEDGWNGLYKGEQAEIGVYYYYVRLLCGNLHNNVMEFKGNVTLVR